MRGTACRLTPCMIRSGSQKSGRGSRWHSCRFKLTKMETWSKMQGNIGSLWRGKTAFRSVVNRMTQKLRKLRKTQKGGRSSNYLIYSVVSGWVRTRSLGCNRRKSSRSLKTMWATRTRVRTTRTSASKKRQQCQRVCRCGMQRVIWVLNNLILILMMGHS